MEEKTIDVDVKLKNGKPCNRVVMFQVAHIVSIETEENGDVYNYRITDILGNEYEGEMPERDKCWVIGTFRMALKGK